METCTSARGFVWEPLRARKQESGCCLSFTERLAVLCNDPANLRRRRAARYTGQPNPEARVVQEPVQLQGDPPTQCDLNAAPVFKTMQNSGEIPAEDFKHLKNDPNKFELEGMDEKATISDHDWKIGVHDLSQASLVGA